mmetsp:Transcript_17484/g.52455  ORF Transcript_17484/g.52455 Transcript_17484/m.52455 type:complete len:241 (-) Transcript_17484:1260-1982(-)
MLLLMLSRWPRNLSQGPAMLMWSVVHLPLALISTKASWMSLPSHFLKGSSSCRRWLSGFTSTLKLPLGLGAWYVSTPASNPFSGSSSPKGDFSRISLPSAPTRVSFSGLKLRSPAMAKAVVSSGLVTKQWVAGLPSLRAAKLRLYDVTMLLASPFFISDRFHWPMQGPQALASTVPPTLSNTSISPSRSMVARICSLPGVMVNGTLALMPASRAWRAMEAERVMSSYELLVQLPIRPAVS